MSKFVEGQRVLYTSQVMHLNAKDEQGKIKPITGTLGKETFREMDETWFDFFPDGWVTPPSGWPRGFQNSDKYLQALEDETLVLPGTITDRTGKPV